MSDKYIIADLVFSHECRLVINRSLQTRLKRIQYRIDLVQMKTV